MNFLYLSNQNLDMRGRGKTNNVHSKHYSKVQRENSVHDSNLEYKDQGEDVTERDGQGQQDDGGSKLSWGFDGNIRSRRFACA